MLELLMEGHILLALGMCVRVAVVILCVSVCLSLCYQASYYMPHFYVGSCVPLGFLCCSQRMYCVDFVENALFKSFDEIC